jgi:hypothetical protein
VWFLPSFFFRWRLRSLSRSARRSRTAFEPRRKEHQRQKQWSGRRDYPDSPLTHRALPLGWRPFSFALRASQSNCVRTSPERTPAAKAMVGPARFELAASSSRTRRSTKLSHGPTKLTKTSAASREAHTMPRTRGAASSLSRMSVVWRSSRARISQQRATLSSSSDSLLKLDFAGSKKRNKSLGVLRKQQAAELTLVPAHSHNGTHDPQIL